MPFHLVDHPVIRDRLTSIRAEASDTAAFRRAVHDASRLLCGEVTRDLETVAVPVTTPVGPASGHRLVRPLVLAPILRAGLGLLQGFVEVLGEAAAATIGLCRDEVSLTPSRYHFRAPAHLAEAEVIVLDPMLATGGSAADALAALQSEGATRVRLACLIAAPEGLAAFSARHPAVPVYAAALDEGLNDKGYIVPGLGDAGDRYFGT